MKIELQRKIDRFVGVPFCLILSFFNRLFNSDTSEIKPEKILVILLSEMGSLVLARPMFQRLKSKYPDASIHVLLFEQNKEFLEVLDVVPQENIFTISNASMLKIFFDSLSVIIKLRRIKINAVIDCELFSRISSIYSFFSGAKLYAGFYSYTQEGLYRGSYINRAIPYNPYQHISQQFITLAEALESNHFPGVKRSTSENHFKAQPLNLNPDEIKKSLNKFKADFPDINVKNLVLIYPGGGLLPIRAWPLDYYMKLAENLIQNGYYIGIIGMQEDKHLAREVISNCRQGCCIDLTGYTETVRDLMIIFHYARLVITNDGGPGHFASMTPIPAITFYGPETPMLYHSLSSNSYNFYLGLSCSPCLTAYNHRNSPCNGDNLCLKNIAPEKVLAKVYELLEKDTAPENNDEPEKI